MLRYLTSFRWLDITKESSLSNGGLSSPCNQQSVIWATRYLVVKIQPENISFNDITQEEQASKNNLGPFKTAFTADQENQLVQHILEMKKRLFGLTMKDLKNLAFQFAGRNRITHNFKKETGMAGKDWLSGFLRRQQTISLRLPEKTYFARAAGFNRLQQNFSSYWVI